MNLWDKWIERVYSETDIGRSIATSVAGLFGLLIYLVTADVAVAGFSAIIVFPIIRLLASSFEKKAAQLEIIKNQENGIQQLYSRLSPEEKIVIGEFMEAGGSVMTWSQMNNASTKFSAIESLLQRGVLHTSMSADGMRETFALDQDIFDYAQKMSEK